MEAIRTYIDNVFKAYEENERITDLKHNLLADMEEKYHALKNEGKSENEVVGTVIANFGNIDEIVAELGVTPGSAEIPEPDNSIYLSDKEAFDFLAITRKSSIGIGFGIWIILTGVAAMLAIGGNAGDNSAIEGAGIFVMFIGIAIAVMLFIVNGIKLSKFEEYEKASIKLDPDVERELKTLSSNFLTEFTMKIAAGVVSVILAVGGFIMFGAIADGNESIQVFLLSGMLFIIGFSVFLLVTAGMAKGAYDVLLGEGDYSNIIHTKKAQEGERIIGTVAAVYWPLATAVYLLWSFVGDSWHISWIIWPVSGIIFGAFAGGISVWHDGKR